MAGPKQLLFICTGNICRSPLAHVYAVHRLGEIGRGDVVVASASTLGITGPPAHELSIQVASENSLDLSQHRARPLTGFLLRESNLVLVMTEEHRYECVRQFKSGRDRVKLLGSFRPDTPDKAPAGEIDDPLGSDIDYFREIWGQIREGVDGLVEQLYV